MQFVRTTDTAIAARIGVTDIIRRNIHAYDDRPCRFLDRAYVG